MEGKARSCVLLSWAVILLFYLCQVIYGVKVLNVTVLSDSNNTYLLRDDRGIIFCNFELDNKTEQLESVHWSTKKGEVLEEFYVWRKDRHSSKAKAAFAGRIDMRERNPRKLVISTANIEMHGDIQCEVKTSKGSDSKETTLVVIQDTCEESNWEITLDKETCIVTIHFKCSGFFPKPTFSCGLYNRGDKPHFVNSFPMDSTSERDNTFDLSVTRNFNASHYIHYDDVVLKCDMIVYGASYKFGVEREVFGERGCDTQYFRDDADVNMTIVEETCWKNPANGSVVMYRCKSSESMKAVTCVNGSWIDDSHGVVSDHVCKNQAPGLSEVQSGVFVSLAAALMLIW